MYIYDHPSSTGLRRVHTLHSIGKASSGENARFAAVCGKRKCIHARLPRLIRQTSAEPRSSRLRVQGRSACMHEMSEMSCGAEGRDESAGGSRGFFTTITTHHSSSSNNSLWPSAYPSLLPQPSREQPPVKPGDQAKAALH